MAVAVTLTKTTLLNTAAAAALALPFWAAPVLGQEAQSTDQAQQSQDTQAQQTDQSQQSGDAGQATTGQASGGQQGQGQGQGQNGGSDVLIATVGDAEIRNSDLMRAIGALPPQLSGQPPEMLVPMALQQLVTRQAIVQQARSQGLAEDPQVQSLVEGATQAAEEDALVQVWLQRELANRVTPEAVEQAYAGLQAVAGNQPVPPLEQIRGQIQQSLAQQAMNEIQASLLSNAQVTLYGPDGQPLQQQQGNAGGQGGNGGTGGQSGNGGGQTNTGGQSGDASGGQDQSQGNAAGGNGSGGESGTGEQSSGGNN